ncbi:MAG TPA: hypothetical protein VLC91_05770 [Spongiibacteraceae bacterium]|nr:hypothetical protein [Spongiibacteraceae bacterium]
MPRCDIAKPGLKTLYTNGRSERLSCCERLAGRLMATISINCFNYLPARLTVLSRVILPPAKLMDNVAKVIVLMDDALFRVALHNRRTLAIFTRPHIRLAIYGAGCERIDRMNAWRPCDAKPGEARGASFADFSAGAQALFAERFFSSLGAYFSRNKCGVLSNS